MAGKKGQVHQQTRQGTGRQKVWQSMRILRRFTLPDLLRTTGERLDNTRKYVTNLTRHGYLRDCGGWLRGEKGSFKSWALVINHGPSHPLVCQRCGLPVTAKACQKQEHAND